MVANRRVEDQLTVIVAGVPEGIVLRIGPNSSTVMLKAVREEIFVGDYVEIE